MAILGQISPEKEKEKEKIEQNPRGEMFTRSHTPKPALH